MVELPEGYERHEGTDITYVIRRGEQPAIQAMGLTTLANLRHRIDQGEPQGRGRVAAIFPKLKERYQPLVLKQVLHGGLYGRLIGGFHLGPERLLRELATTEKARDLGVPVPEIAYLAWSSSRPCMLFLATVRVTASRNLAQLLREEPDGRVRSRSLRAAARSVREMHDAGLIHSDLNLRNLMVTELTGEPEGFVLDLDRSDITDAGLTGVSEMASLKKLHLAGANVTDTGLQHLGRLTGLESLGLRDTKVTDAGLKHLGRLMRRPGAWASAFYWWRAAQ